MAIPIMSKMLSAGGEFVNTTQLTNALTSVSPAVGEVRTSFASTIPPGWIPCNGQPLPNLAGRIKDSAFCQISPRLSFGSMLNVYILDNGKGIAAFPTSESNTTKLCYTSDGGETWSESNLTRCLYHKPMITLAEDGHGFFGIPYTGSSPYRYMYRTADFGKTWTTVSPLFGASNGVLMQGNHVAIGKTSNNGRDMRIAYSDDFGVTWKDSKPFDATCQFSEVITMYPSGVCIAIAYGNSQYKVIRSTDFGATWEIRHTIGQQPIIYNSKCYEFSNGDSLIACADGIYTSHDRFSNPSRSLISNNICSIYINETTGTGYCIERRGRYFVTTNFGFEWTEIRLPFEEIKSGLGKSYQFWIANDIGLLEERWIERVPNSTNTQSSSTDYTFQRLFSTDDGGQSWQPLLPRTNNNSYLNVVVQQRLFSTKYMFGDAVVEYDKVIQHARISRGTYAPIIPNAYMYIGAGG